MNLAGNTVLGPKPGRALVPLLVILFLVSYGLLTTLVVEQGNTIRSQSTLMHLLLKDSFHLSALKAELRKNQTVLASNAPAAPNSQANGPLSQKSLEKIPVIQVPSVDAGSSRPKAPAAARKSGKAGKAPSVRPPAELTDPSDMRRVSFSI